MVTSTLSLQTSASQDLRFFSLLESGVDGALALTRLLTNIPKYRTHSHPPDEFGLARGKDKNITERLDWTPQRMAAVDFAMPTELIERATSMRSEMVRQLRYNPTLAMMKQMNDRSQRSSRRLAM